MIKLEDLTEQEREELYESLTESEFRQIAEEFYCAECMTIWYQCPSDNCTCQ